MSKAAQDSSASAPGIAVLRAEAMQVEPEIISFVSGTACGHARQGNVHVSVEHRKHFAAMEPR